MSDPPAGTLISTSARAGVTAGEIVDLALAAANAKIAWSHVGCAAFAWGISNLAGLPFFDRSNHTAQNNPLKPLDDAYSVPHKASRGTSDAAGDGWYLASTERSVSALAAALKPGDIVRVYAAGNDTEASLLNGKAVGHSFVVVSVSNGNVQVVDNWSGGVISQHSLSVITSAFAPGGSFGSVYVSRIDTNWVSSHVDPSSVQGLGLGDWSTFIDTTPPHLQGTSPADEASKVALDANIILTFDEKVAAGTGTFDIVGKNGTVFESISAGSSQVHVSGSSVTIDPKGTFASGGEYYVVAKSGVITDTAGNAFAGLTKTQLNFTAVVDKTAPKLVSTLPADNAGKVATGADIELKFNETVQAGSGQIDIYKSDGKLFESIAVSSSRVHIAGDTVTIDPKATLAAGTGYYVIIKSGVLDDLAGNHFAGLAKNDLNFTTSSSSAKAASVGSIALSSTGPDSSTSAAGDGHSTLTSAGHDGSSIVEILRDALGLHGELLQADAGSFNQVSASAFGDHGSDVIFTTSSVAEPILEHWTFG
jgi:methionine-rich copper-binding protein CopC